MPVVQALEGLVQQMRAEPTACSPVMRLAFIAEHGRWSPMSPQVHEYVRAVDHWKDNPMRGIGF